LRAFGFRSSQIFAASAINSIAINFIPVVKMAITHVISEDTASTQVIEENTGIWILDHELIADGLSISASFR
jgi:hypothetical protein